MNWIQINSLLINLDRIDCITYEDKKISFWRDGQTANSFFVDIDQSDQVIREILLTLKCKYIYINKEPPKEEAL